jgi:hypothetical protein
VANALRLKSQAVEAVKEQAIIHKPWEEGIMRRIAWGILMLMFLAGSLCATACGGGGEEETRDLTQMEETGE